MKKNTSLSLLIITACIALSGCDSQNTDITKNYKLTDDLQGCTVSKITSSGFTKDLYVVRCPNSTTHTSGAKTGDVSLVLY